MEALSCGTPVIAFPSGALPEIIEDGRTGFIVQNEQEMAAALTAVRYIDPEVCRQTARERFSAARMTRRYIDLYQKLAMEQAPRPVLEQPCISNQSTSSTA
jgi:glycosyltransferase involved in cell wall biosynthesis